METKAHFSQRPDSSAYLRCVIGGGAIDESSSAIRLPKIQPLLVKMNDLSYSLKIIRASLP
jgi:hypothetical protein